MYNGCLYFIIHIIRIDSIETQFIKEIYCSSLLYKSIDSWLRVHPLRCIGMHKDLICHF